MTTESAINILLRGRGWRFLGFFASSNAAMIERDGHRHRITLPDPFIEKHDVRRWAGLFLDALDQLEDSLEAARVRRDSIKPWSPYP